VIPIGCNCGSKGSSALYNVEVRFKDGSTEVYKDRASARIAMSAKKMTGSMRQVSAKTHPVTA
jgi:hypothetical protein